jgi:hypothetical protein
LCEAFLGKVRKGGKATISKLLVAVSLWTRSSKLSFWH